MEETNTADQLTPVYEGSLDEANKRAKHLEIAGIPHSVQIAAESDPDS